MTKTEKILWKRLRSRKYAHLKIRRQVGIGPFIVDFYHAGSKLIIEIDGLIHEWRQEEDAVREQFLRNHGYRIIRFTNYEVLESLQGVLQRIALAVVQPRSLALPQKGEGGGP
jgi:very-short-patch-repair endonuclease